MITPHLFRFGDPVSGDSKTSDSGKGVVTQHVTVRRVADVVRLLILARTVRGHASKRGPALAELADSNDHWSDGTCFHLDQSKRRKRAPLDDPSTADFVEPGAPDGVFVRHRCFANLLHGHDRAA